MKALFKILFIAFLLLATAGVGWCTTYHVGTGQTYTTFAAFHAAVTPSPGDVIDGGGEVFDEQVTINANGSSGNVITYQNFTVDRNGAVDSYGIRVTNHTYITLNNITVRECKKAGIRCYANSIDDVIIEKHITINNCTVYDCGEYANIDLRGQYITISNCTIYDADYDAIYCEGDHFTAIRNTIYNVGRVNDGDGVQIGASDNVDISNNNITSQGTNPHCGIAATGVGGVISIESNTIIINNSPDYPSAIYCEYADPTITNNQCYGGYYGINLRGGIVYYNKTSGATYAGIWAHANEDPVYAYNNTSYNNGRGIRAEYGAKNVMIKNNILSGNTYGISVNTTGTKISDYNNFYNNTTDTNGVTEGSNSIYANPLLNTSYYLKKGSPCIDAGTTISGVTNEYYGDAVDIGWKEYKRRCGGFLNGQLTLGAYGKLKRTQP